MEERRDKRNIVYFIISYVINNLASGVLYDTFVNYLQEAQTSIATSFWAFYGYATFISAALLLLVPKIGYKKLLLFCSLSTACAFFGAVCMDFTWALYIATLLALTGVQLHFIMLSPFIACYTEAFKNQEIHWYTRTYYMGYIGYFLATRYMTHLSSGLHQSYMDANRMVLFVVGCIALISLIPVLCISEKKSDYQMELTPRLSLKEKMNGARQLLLNRYSRAYLLYWALISFAMGLFTSYYTVYLNRNLHIDKATSSLMVSISYVAIVLFMFFTPKCTKKFGKVGTIFLTVMASIPFMLMIGNGNYFGEYVVPIVGASLFIRAGLANLSSPVDSALSMDVICKDLRPVYTSVVNFTAGVVSILSGHFTGKILFVHQSGYQQAYFIAAILYAIAGMVLYHGLHTFNHKESEIVLSKGEKR